MSAEAVKKRGRPKNASISEQEVAFTEEPANPKPKRAPARKKSSPVIEEVAQPLSKTAGLPDGAVRSELTIVDSAIPQQENGADRATGQAAKQREIQSQLLQQASAFANRVELGTASLREEVTTRKLNSQQESVRAGALRRAWEQSSQQHQAAKHEALTVSQAVASTPVATITSSRTTESTPSYSTDRTPMMSKPSKSIPSIPAFEKKPEARPPLRPAQLSYQELKKNPEFKSLSRKYTGVLVGVPFLIVTSYVLYNRYQETLVRREPGSQSAPQRNGGPTPRILEDAHVIQKPNQSPIDTLWGKRPGNKKRILEE